MNDSIKTYLHDHLAGSNFAIHMLESVHEQHKDESLGTFILALTAEIKQDQAVLQEIIDEVGTPVLDVAGVAGWVAEKVSQFKLNRTTHGDLGTFEALETLTLGIKGKVALWKTLTAVSEFDPRVPKRNYLDLIERAEDQFRRAETRRLALAVSAFSAGLPG